MYGVSYDGLTTGAGAAAAHPALKAMSEQASPVINGMNDDDHRYGAATRKTIFEYAVMEQADKNRTRILRLKRTTPTNGILNLGPLGTSTRNTCT